jgi:hypothetical protein
VPGGQDPAARQEAAHKTARLLVDGVRSSKDAEIAGRLVELAAEHGLDLLADLWADSPPESLPGALWRLYALQAWVRADPAAAARQFAEGRRRAPVLEVVAGVADPPGPEQVRDLLDTVLRGVCRGDLATTLDRAAAFARIVAVGRADIASDTDAGYAGDQASALTHSAGRLVRTAEQLEASAVRWREGALT